MFKFTNRQELLCLLVLGVLSHSTLSADAAYEVVNARTIDTEIATAKTLPVYTFNDPELPDFVNDESVGVKAEKKIKNIFSKKRTQKDDELIEEEVLGADVTVEVKKDEVVAKEETISDKNKFLIDADKIYYEEENGSVFAKGNVQITAKLQDVVLKADEAVLDKTNHAIRLYNNVAIIKDGTEMRGESLVVDLNEQNILMDNPSMEAYSFVMNAQEGYLIANDIQMLNGVVSSSKKTNFPLITNGFMALDPAGRELMHFADDLILPPKEEQSKKAYRIDSKQIVLTSYKDHDSILLKGSNVFYNNKKLIRNSDIEIISDKQKQVIETNLPEAGSLRNFGMYLGYGIVQRLPRGQSLKLMPAVTYGDSNFGVGLIGRYRSQNGMLEGGWNTSTTNVVARGVYRFNDALRLDYGRNAYMPEGFMGSRRSGYAAQLTYKKMYRVEDLGVDFSNAVSAGIFSDYQKHDQENAYATTRFRYMAEMSKNIFKYKNEEQDFKMHLDAVAQASATLYGSGQTHGVVRVGPTVTTKYRRWDSTIGYFLGGIHGDSPFTFDRYRYGKSTIVLNEKFNVCDKLAFGFRIYVSPLKDNYLNDLLTEARVYAMVGPQDMKVALSYDFIRDIAHFDFMLLLGSDSARINFDKLITKNLNSTDSKKDFYKNAKKSQPTVVEDI